MNKEKKIELLSNALVAEMKILLRYHFSNEETEVILKLLSKNVEKVIVNLFIQKVKDLYKKVNFWKLIYQTLKLYWTLNQLRAEMLVLLEESFNRLEQRFKEPINLEAHLNLNGALLAIVEQELFSLGF